MSEPLPDQKLRRALDQVDQLKEQLRVEKIRAGNLAARLAKAQRAADAKAQQPELRTR